MFIERALKTLIVLSVILNEQCLSVNVPVYWGYDASSAYSENKPAKLHQQNFAVETFDPKIFKPAQTPIPAQYFEYTAPKPNFAVEVATLHGVKNPHQHFKSYSIHPYTRQPPPELGKHTLLNSKKETFQPYQKFVRGQGFDSPVTPIKSDFEIFHPYKSEQLALKQIYKDPVLDKIRGDLRSSQLRLQNYEKAAGEPNITKSEYLESLDETDRKHGPQTNIPAAYEIHHPQRKPVYYNPTPNHAIRDHYLNQKFKHPLRQDYIKITPVHYFPLKNQLQQLRQSHASKYDDEHNEYPQIIPSQQFAEPPEGYDIYEKGKQRYVQLRNNVDNTVNKVLNDNRVAPFGRLELQNNGKYNNEQEENENDAHEFVPIKNYAQVRKTELMKHLPKSAAYAEAENLDELRDAPRLKEAIKSTKAQTVYTEEGYEDSAYDHAGEQKHAADHEGHAGYLKEDKKSDGKYKTPSFSGAFDDASGSIEGDQVTHGKKWEKVNKDTEEEADSEGFAQDDHEKVIDADDFTDDEQDTTVASSDKRENTNSQQADFESSFVNNKSMSEEETDKDLTNHDVNKREVNFKVPEFTLNNTFLTEDELLRISKEKIPPTENSKDDASLKKYPYYTKKIGEFLNDSPLRYAENLKLVPRKSRGGSEFYDSRSNMACPEVDEEVDPLPEKIKQNGTESDSSENEEGTERVKRETSDKTVENQKPRLFGLGDKIDCFKAKYFGENPLDSPFFKEDLIGNPEPVTLPNHPVYKLKRFIEPESKDTKFGIISNITARLKDQNEKEITSLFDKLKLGQENLQQSLINSNTKLKSSLINSQQSVTTPIIIQQNTTNGFSNIPKSNLYTSIFDNINKDSQRSFLKDSIFGNNFGFSLDTNTNTNKTSNIFLKPTEITYHAPYARQKRSGTFVYEPYKIIKEDQSQESKKTTTLSNVSPLIKKLQSSKVAEKISLKVNSGLDSSNKQNVAKKTYKEIGKNDRIRYMDYVEPEFVDVSTDARRGEPRYEIKHPNHKSEYEPVVNQKSLTLEAYKSKVNQDEDFKTTTQSTKKPVYDVSQFLPKPIDLQNTAASRTVHRIIRSTTPAAEKNSRKTGLVVKSAPQKQEQDEEYEDYQDEEPIATTTTMKPVFRRRRTTTSTTEQPTNKNDKLRLVTRFRESTPAKEVTEKPEIKIMQVNEQKESNLPKYREKSTKSSKSTLVKDTKRYGGDDDDMKKEEIDKLIGVKQNMEDYTPEYEKKMNNKGRTGSEEAKESHNEEDYDEDSFSDEIDDDDDDEFSDEDDYDEEEDQGEEEDEEKPVPTTTPKPKNTLTKTTEIPQTTTETRSEKLQIKPIIMRKKIEIHKELPVNTSAPHVTQFKQDIKEVEIIKELPQRKPSKNTEVLDLYKDENLPKEINKLGDVEVFKANLDLNGGPKHGGNYRSAKLIELADNTSPKTLHGGNLRAQPVLQKEDAVSSQSQKSGTNVPVNRMHGGNLRSLSEIASAQQPNVKRRRGNKNAKTVELNEKLTEPMHGGNLRSYTDINRQKGNTKVTGPNDNEGAKSRTGNAELHGGNLQTYTRNNNNDNGRSLHGGNYRNAKLTEGERTTKYSQTKRNNDERTTAAKLLTSFVQAAPILTTTPSYILDPSKRMYFYVEA